MEADDGSSGDIANGGHPVLPPEADPPASVDTPEEMDVSGSEAVSTSGSARELTSCDTAGTEENPTRRSDIVEVSTINGVSDESASVKNRESTEPAQELSVNGTLHQNGTSGASVSKPGDVVWAKIQKHRWPCVVQDPLTCPEEVVGGLRRKPVAVVKFHGEEKYELISSEDRVSPYDHPDKLEFIRKTMKSLQGDLLQKFRHDVDESERMTGSSGDVWEKLAAEERALNASKKTLKAAFDKPREIVEERIHYMTYLGDFEDPYVDKETEAKKIATEVRGTEEYKCPWCDFRTTRVDNVVFHIKVHSANGPRFEPQLGVKAWMTAREQRSAKQKRKRMKQLAREAAKVPIVLGPDGKRTKNAESPDSGPSKKKRKKEKKLPDASDLAADWEEDDEEEKPQEPPPPAQERPVEEEPKSVKTNHESFLERQKQSENMFDALLRNEDTPKQPKKFSRFCLPASKGIGNDDDSASENGVAEDSMSDGVFDDDDFFALGSGQSPSRDDSDEEEELRPPSRRSSGGEEASGVESANRQSEDKDEASAERHREAQEETDEAVGAAVQEEVVDDTEWTFAEYSTVAGVFDVEGGDIIMEAPSAEEVIDETATRVQNVEESPPEDVPENSEPSLAPTDEVPDGATLATVEIAEGNTISSSGSRPAVIVAQRDPETGEEKMLLVTVDDGGKVQSITPLDALSVDEQARLAREIGLSSDGRTTLPQQLSSRFSEENAVVTVGNISAEGAEAAAAVVRENPSIEEGVGPVVEA